jgi:hypothetical protein
MRALALALLLTACSVASGQPTVTERGSYAPRATLFGIMPDETDPQVVLPSPNGRSRLIARPTGPDGATAGELELRGALGSGRVPLAHSPNNEVLWSPNSSLAMVTVNDGGFVGNYHLRVIGSFGGAGPEVRDLSLMLREAFGRPVRCGVPGAEYFEPPNVVGVDWLDDRRLLTAVQIQHHSVCEKMGTFKAYVVDVQDMRIVEVIGQLEAKARFGERLGAGLREAPDECVRTTEACTRDWSVAVATRP